jgi:thioredoxin-dependent peroxiredoxin
MRTSKVTWGRAVVVLMVFVALLGASYGVLNAGDKPPMAGTVAPDFTLNSQDGTPVNLHDYRGKWVVLYFYPKDFTSGCTTEAHNFQRDLAQYQQKDAVILGVSVDSADSHQKFCTKEGLNFKLLADSDHKVSEVYGSIMNLGVKKLSARHTFIISPDGVIIRVFVEVNPGNHSEEVLAALTELQKTTPSTR